MGRESKTFTDAEPGMDFDGSTVSAVDTQEVHNTFYADGNRHDNNNERTGSSEASSFAMSSTADTRNFV